MNALHWIGRRLRYDTNGVAGPMIAVMSTSLLAAGGLALDVGLYYMGNRDLRSATEAAALAAAMNPAQAQARAADYLVKNGYPASVLKSVQVGYYCANMRWSTASRFVGGSAPPADCPGASSVGGNAVQVVTTKPSRRFLTGVLGKAALIPDLTATASAARIDEAGLAITCDVVLASGITTSLVSTVNTLLGALLDVRLNLSSPDVSALMEGNVDAGLFFDALARRQGFQGTYGELVQQSFGLKDIAQAAAEAAYNPATASALNKVGAVSSNAAAVPLASLFGVGTWRHVPVAGGHAPPTPSALRAGLNAYQLIAFAAQAGPGVIDASEIVSLALPDTIVRLAAVANGAAAQPRFSFGPAGETKVSTSQVRLQLLVGLGRIRLPIGNLLDVSVNEVPLVIDLAPASARIDQINCAGTDLQVERTSARLWVESGLARVYIANVPGSVISKSMPAIEPTTPANLINLSVLGGLLGGIQVNARAHLVAGQVAAVGNTFDITGQMVGSPARAATPVSLRSRAQVGATVNSLTQQVDSSLDVQVKVAGLLDLGTGQLLRNSLLTGITRPLVQPIDGGVNTIVDTILAALGLQLGNATVAVTGARCGVPVLI